MPTPIDPNKPITEKNIPGTEVPDVRYAPAESVKQRRWMSAVAVTTAVLAALASISSMFSGDNLNTAMVDKIEMSDQYGYYQAKSIKANILETKLSLLSNLGKPADPKELSQLETYNTEKEKIAADAEAAKKSANQHLKAHTLEGYAATAFQVAIAMCAIALLTRKNPFWLLSLALLIVGSVFFTLGLLG